MLAHQLGRRNLTPEQVSYLRGKQYQAQRKGVGRPEKNTEKDSELNPAAKLANEHKITERAIYNDAKFATAIDTVAAAVPDAKQTILSRNTKVGLQARQWRAWPMLRMVSPLRDDCCGTP